MEKYLVDATPPPAPRRLSRPAADYRRDATPLDRDEDDDDDDDDGAGAGAGGGAGGGGGGRATPVVHGHDVTSLRATLSDVKPLPLHGPLNSDGKQQTWANYNGTM